MKRVLATVIAVSFGFLTVVCTNIASAQDSGRKVLRVNGAGMASDQVDKWAKRFMEANPGIAVTVIGSSAGKGFQALLSGAAEIAMMSREISADERKKANEKGLKLAEKPIGQAAVALITNPRNPLSELTLQQVKGTYTGQYVNWKEVGGPDEPVRCLTRRVPESGGAVFFQEQSPERRPFWSQNRDDGNLGSDCQSVRGGSRLANRNRAQHAQPEHGKNPGNEKRRHVPGGDADRREYKERQLPYYADVCLCLGCGI